MKILRDLFERVRRANLKIKPSKTKFCYPEVEFLGHIISDGKVKPMQANIEKIVNAPIPKMKKGVRSLLGPIGFLRKFIGDCSGLLQPIIDLTGKNMSEKVVWHQEAFDKVKSCLTNELVLSLFQQGREHVIQTDACNEQIGATLLQREDDGGVTPCSVCQPKITS